MFELVIAHSSVATDSPPKMLESYCCTEWRVPAKHKRLYKSKGKKQAAEPHKNHRQITLRLQYNVLMGNSGSWYLCECSLTHKNPTKHCFTQSKPLFTVCAPWFGTSCCAQSDLNLGKSEGKLRHIPEQFFLCVWQGLSRDIHRNIRAAVFRKKVCISHYNPPWGRSSRSTGCASPRDTVGSWCPGCGSQWQPTEPHTPSSGWCTAWCHPPRRASWEEAPWWTTSRTCRFCWRSNKGHRGCSTGRAWCWSAGGRSRPNLQHVNP